MRSRLVPILSSTLLALGLLATAATPAHSAEPTVTDGCLKSVPEPGSTTPVDICYTLFQPADARPGRTAPMVLHSHGWAGSRTSSATAFGAWLDAGFGVLSFDQRGFGESGGLAHVQHPDFEGQDVIRLVDLVSTLPWVTMDGPGDPRLGAIGGSYGGGYQFVGAFTELRDRGRTRFDAIAPQMTWWDVKESLAPQEVPRTAWAAALYAAGARDLPQEVHQGFAYAAATGDWPRGQDPLAPNLDAFFEKNGPAWHVAEGRQLNIPALVYQGATDNLFNLNQGLKNFNRALTWRAKARSVFVSYNGGHALPSFVPPGTQAAGEPCAPAITGDQVATYDDVARSFFRESLKHESAGIGPRGRYYFATQGGNCISARNASADTELPVGDLLIPSGAGAPQSTLVAEGPITVAGIPHLTTSVTTTGLDTRLFLALAVGSSPTDARIVQNNMLPLHERAPVAGANRSIELPGVAVQVPEGQNLYLTVSPVSDTSFGHSSRTPGVVSLENSILSLNTQL